MNYLTLELRNSEGINFIIKEILEFKKENKGKVYQVNIKTPVKGISIRCLETHIQSSNINSLITEKKLKISSFKTFLSESLLSILRS